MFNMTIVDVRQTKISRPLRPRMMIPDANSTFVKPMRRRGIIWQFSRWSFVVGLSRTICTTPRSASDSDWQTYLRDRKCKTETEATIFGLEIGLMFLVSKSHRRRKDRRRKEGDYVFVAKSLWFPKNLSTYFDKKTLSSCWAFLNPR